MGLFDLIKNLFKKEEKVVEKDETTKELEELIKILADTSPVIQEEKMDEREQRVEKAEELFLSGKITTPDEYIAVLDGEEPMAQDIVETILAEPNDQQKFIDATKEEVEHLMSDMANALAEIDKQEEPLPTEKTSLPPEMYKVVADMFDRFSQQIESDPDPENPDSKSIEEAMAQITNEGLKIEAETPVVSDLGPITEFTLETPEATLTSAFVPADELKTFMVEESQLRISPSYDRKAVALELLKALVIGYGKPLELVSRDHHRFLITNALTLTDAFIAELKK